ncbi:MAG: hypothetical protein GX130_02105 [Candidatus Hydrogenedens sp.]|nr:hypothetical protein [Candidatus Hydrogenedens sp.]
MPEHTGAPVFYIFFYYWSKITGMNPLYLRLLPVAFGTAAIVLMYFLGTSLYSRRAGLISALLLALSPTQIWFAQELRPYGLMFFLALLSLLSLQHALSSPTKKSRLWLLYYCATALFLFNHLFSVLILIPQGIYVLLRRGFSFFILWALPAVILVTILFFSAFDISHTTEEQGRVAPPPEIITALTNAVGQDIINTRWFFFSPWHNHPTGELPDSLLLFLKVRPFMDGLIFLFITISLLVFVFYSAETSLRIQFLENKFKKVSCQPLTCINKSGEEIYFERNLLSKFMLIISLFCVSPLVLGTVQAVTGRPTFNPVYNAYNMAALYLAIGFAASCFNKKWIYKSSILLVILLYGYQCLIFLPYRTRPAWNEAAAYIRQNSGLQDLIIDEWSLAPFSRIDHYLNDFQVKKVNATSLGDVCAQAALFLQNQDHTDDLQPAVWILTEPVFLYYFGGMPKNPLRILEASLEECGLHVEATYFPGSTHLTVLKATCTQGQEPRIPVPIPQLLDIADYSSFFDDLGVHVDNEEEKQQLIYGFQRSTSAWPLFLTIGNFEVGFSFLRNKEYRLAGAFAEYLLSSHPYFGLGYYYMGTLLALAGETDRARAYFSQAFSLYPVIASYSEAFSRALCEPGEALPDKAAADRLFSFPYPLFVDLQRYLEETAVFTESGPKIKILPGHERVRLASELTDGAVLIDALFTAQKNNRKAEAWMPITKRLPALTAELSYCLTGNPERTANKYRELIGRFPFECFFYDRYDYFLKKYADVHAYVTNWLELVSANPDLSAYAVQKLEAVGNDWYELDNNEAALAAFQGASMLGSFSLDTAARTGEVYARQFRFKEALTIYAEVLKKDAQFSNVLVNTDIVLNELDDEQYRLDYWKDIHESNPHSWDITRRYGGTLEEAGFFTDATRIYLVLKDSEAHGCDALVAAIRCLRLSGDYKTALTLLEQQNPERCHPPKLITYEYISIGQLLVDQQLLKEAEECFNQALAIGGFDGLAYFELGTLARAKGDGRETLGYFTKSVKADPDALWPRQCLAVEQLNNGLYAEALENYKILFLQNPDVSGLRQTILSLVEKHDDAIPEDQLQELHELFPDWFILQ